MLIYLYPALALLLTTSLFFLSYFFRKHEKIIKTCIKVGIIILALIIFLKSFLDDGYLTKLNNGSYHDVVYNDPDFLEAFVRIFLSFGGLLTASLLLKDNKVIKTILLYVVAPLMIYCLVLVGRSIEYYTTIRFLDEFKLPNPLIGFLSLLEIAIIIDVPLISRFVLKEDLSLKDKKDWGFAIKTGIIAFLVSIPYYVYPGLFGSTTIVIDFMNIYHLGWVLSILGVALVIYFLYRGYDLDEKELIMGIIVFALFYHFNACFKLGFRFNRLPLQLCNFASYVFVIVAFTKKKGLFDFIYTANPIGAVIAVATLSETGEIFGFWMIHYLIEHLYVFIIPLLYVALGIFKRPNLKQMTIHFLIGFNLYFFACFFINCFNNGVIVPAFGNEYINNVNFFYLLDCPVKDVLPFYKDLELVPLSIFGTQFYLVYTFFIYFVFIALAYVIYFVEGGVTALIHLCQKAMGKEKEKIRQ